MCDLAWIGWIGVRKQDTMRLGDLLAKYSQENGKEGGGAKTAGSMGGKSLYASQQYWESRFENGCIGMSTQRGTDNNEWYLGYPSFQHIFTAHCCKAGPLLVLGNGLSLLAEQLADDGYQSIIAVDYSQHATQRMQAREAGRRAARPDIPLNGEAGHQRGQVEYQVMDVTQLQFSDGSFACVVDKATLDCLLSCDESSQGAAVASGSGSSDDDSHGDGQPGQQPVGCSRDTLQGHATSSIAAAADARPGKAPGATPGEAAGTTPAERMLQEAYRVLRPGGVFLCISHSFREEMLLNSGAWDVVHHEDVRKGVAASFSAHVLRKGKASRRR